MLNILDLFTAERSVIDPDYVCEVLGCAQASAYRYIRELTEVGLLVRFPGGYILGPRIIELDLQMSEHDPIISAGKALMAEIANDTGMTLLLSELYGNKVIAVHVEKGRDTDDLNFGRGRPMDLFHSATARVILAYLLPRQLKRLYDSASDLSHLQKIGRTWKEFSKAMLQIRKDGYCISFGELDPNKAGLSAPIFNENNKILGSITLVGTTDRLRAFNQDYLATTIVSAAQAITRAISG
jgi:DNA-binding IclR family transcriptional regulator